MLAVPLAPPTTATPSVSVRLPVLASMAVAEFELTQVEPPVMVTDELMVKAPLALWLSAQMTQVPIPPTTCTSAWAFADALSMSMIGRNSVGNRCVTSASM